MIRTGNDVIATSIRLKIEFEIGGNVFSKQVCATAALSIWDMLTVLDRIFLAHYSSSACYQPLWLLDLENEVENLNHSETGILGKNGGSLFC